ncbi:MAG: hypothetical protein HMLKMBBP_02355 [Planctomycetes bacterium]|nr:hypothetical protein [Planctomycetota bacterium]
MTRFIAGSLMLAAAPAAWAADLEVGKGRTYESIQDAINAAQPGDRILVRPGTYARGIEIPPGKDGLQLIGKRAVIDGHDETGSSSTPIEVDSHDVVVEGFTIRNGSSYAVDVEGDRFTIRNCRIRNADEYGLYVSGAGLLAEDVDFLGGLERAVTVTGAGAVLRRLRIRGWGEGAVDVSGDGATVEDVDARVIEDGDGIRIHGADGTVRRCSVVGADSTGIEVEGLGTALVDACTVRAASYTGIRADGTTASVTGCVVRGAGSAGIVLQGTTVSASRNTVSNTGAGNTGIAVTQPFGGVTPDPTALLEDNAVDGCVGWGFALQSPGAVTMRRNRTARTGAGTSSGGFHIGAGSLAMEDCTSDRAADTAFQIARNGADGGAFTLLRCVATRAAGDGFQIVASAATLEDCRAEGCGGEGVHNAATGVTVTGCVLRRNRIDLANESGNGATFANDVAADNEYGSGGPATEPEIDFPDA